MPSTGLMQPRQVAGKGVKNVSFYVNRTLRKQIQTTFPIIYAKALELVIKDHDIDSARAGNPWGFEMLGQAAYSIAAGLMTQAFGEDWRSIGGF